jgi:glycerol-3-phosphate acyltransferase PlsY
MTQLIAILFTGYLIGNFSPAYLFGRIVGHFDIRERGSGNAGATNVLRLIGWRYGALVFILDMLKGLAASSIGFWLAGYPGMAASAIGVIVGHDFPALLKFKGGKGIASTTGIFLSLFPLPTLVAILVFVTVVLLTRMVSVGSLVFVICMAIYTLVSHQPVILVITAVLAAVFAIVRHRENILRILRGVENKISFGKKVKQDSGTEG